MNYQTIWQPKFHTRAFFNRFKCFRGQAMVEYILILALIASVVFAFKSEFSLKVSNLFSDNIQQPMQGAAQRGGESQLGDYYTASDVTIRSGR